MAAFVLAIVVESVCRALQQAEIILCCDMSSLPVAVVCGEKVALECFPARTCQGGGLGFVEGMAT